MKNSDYFCIDCGTDHHVMILYVKLICHKCIAIFLLWYKEGATGAW